MPLALTKPDASTFRYYYEGAIGVTGVGVTQTLDLTTIPEQIRSDPSFVDNWRVFVVSLNAGLSAMSHLVDFTLDADDLPIAMVITLTSDAIGRECSIEAVYQHSEVR
jgi:hypothetical protein